MRSFVNEYKCKYALAYFYFNVLQGKLNTCHASHSEGLSSSRSFIIWIRVSQRRTVSLVTIGRIRGSSSSSSSRVSMLDIKLVIKEINLNLTKIGQFLTNLS